VEAIFPSQGPTAIVGAKTGELSNGSPTPQALAEKQHDEEEAKWDNFYMAAVIILTLVLMGLMMVSKYISDPRVILKSHLQFTIAWFLGARFDLAFQDILSRLNPSITRPATSNGVVRPREHAEL